MKTKILAVAILSALTSVSAVAAEPSFNLLEGGYTKLEDSDGFLMRGSVELTDNIYVIGSYIDVSEDGQGFEAKEALITFGAGWQSAISESTAVYGEVEYLDYSWEFETSLGSLDNSDDGYILSAGIRSMVAETTEVYGELSHRSIDDDAATVGTLGVRQYLSETLGVFAEISEDDFSNSAYAVGVSFKF